MRSYVVFIAVCVALAAGSVFKRDTQATTTQFSYDDIQKHLDEMMKSVKGGAEQASGLMQTAADTTSRLLKELQSKANDTVLSITPELQEQGKKFIAFLDQAQASMSESVKNNAPEAHKYLTNTVKDVTAKYNEVKETLGPNAEKIMAQVKSTFEQLEKKVHDEIGHNH